MPVCRQWWCPFCRARQVRRDAEALWAAAKADPSLRVALAHRETHMDGGLGAVQDLPPLSVAGIFGGATGLVAGAAYRKPYISAREGKNHREWAVADIAVALVRPADPRPPVPPLLPSRRRPRPVVSPDRLRPAARSVVVSDVARAGAYPKWLFFSPPDVAVEAVRSWYRVRMSTRVGKARAAYGSAAKDGDPSESVD